MRLHPKPAAATAGGAFLLLLFLSLAWPGTGIWLLVVGILFGLTAGYLWYAERLSRENHPYAAPTVTPFANVGAYGLIGPAVRTARTASRNHRAVPLAGVLAPISALAILLFVGGTIGTGEVSESVPSTTPLQRNVTAIDRSGDGELAAPSAQTPGAQQATSDDPSAAVSTVTVRGTTVGTPNAAQESEAQPSAPVKPIVVAAPKPASAADEESEEIELAPRSANTFEYIVEAGDTLYDIAEQYGSTVDALMSLNKLDSFSFIHPGDILLIPKETDEADES